MTNIRYQGRRLQPHLTNSFTIGTHNFRHRTLQLQRRMTRFARREFVNHFVFCQPQVTTVPLVGHHLGTVTFYRRLAVF